MYYVLHCRPSILGRRQNSNTKVDTRFLDIARSVFPVLPKKCLNKSRVGFNLFTKSGVELGFKEGWAMVDFELYLNFRINAGFGRANDQ